MKIENQSNRSIKAIDKADIILQKVMILTGLPYSLGTSIVVYPSQREVTIKFQYTYPNSKRNPASFYVKEFDTIYCSPSITPHMLAHEFTHALLDKYIGKQLPAPIIEVLPRWVDANIDFGWWF